MDKPEIITAVQPVLDVFRRLEISCYLGGSVASSLYGMARSTLDVDVVADLRLEHVPLIKAVLEAGYYFSEPSIREAIQQRASFNLVHLETMLKVDIFVLGTDAYGQQAMRRRQESIWGGEDLGLGCAVASPEDVILSKLRWFDMGGRSSERQWQDVIGVIRVQSDRLDRSYLKHWATELHLADLLEKALKEGTD